MMFVSTAVALAIISTTARAAYANSTQFTSLVVFGDSFSDNGRKGYLLHDSDRGEDIFG
jgi:phospholipase/lecithinase/hemolysin